MEEREKVLGEVKTWGHALIGKVRSINELMNAPEGIEKTRLILKEKAAVKRFCNLYIRYIKELWHEGSTNTGQFNKKPKYVEKEEAMLNEVITKEEADKTKAISLETPKERLMRIRKEKGLI